MHARTLYPPPSPSHCKPPTCSWKEGRFWNEVGWVGGELAHPPLDFPSLSAKIPPNYRITGDLGCVSGWGPKWRQQAPALTTPTMGPGD